VIEVKELTRRFGGITAVDGATFEVPAGRLTGFVGGNGAGKTTTMRMIMGLLGIDHGTVLWQGSPLATADRRRFGYMPEERGLYPKQKVLGQLTYLGELSGMTTTKARRAVCDQLELFGLTARANERVEKLSLGNQQRVQIIAALLHDPIALILDEPFSGLDPTAVDSMVELLRERTTRGVPVLFSSHQLDLVERLCDHLVVLSHGRVVATGSVAQLRSHGPERLRLVMDRDAGWVRELRGVHVVDVDGPVALLELEGNAAMAQELAIRRLLLTRALEQGNVLELHRVVTPLSEIYREVTA
jgi:ABC-2 type transport system ATP-binding protein